MRILYHHRTLGDGAEAIHIREMVSAFKVLGHDVRVVSPVASQRHAGYSDQLRSRKTRDWSVLTARLPRAVYEFAELAYNFVGKRKVLQAIQDFRPDFIYDRYNSYCTAAVSAAKQRNVPLILEVNAPMAFERVEYEKNRLAFPQLAKRYEQWICQQSSHIVAVSSPLQAFLQEHCGLDTDKVSMMPNGADPDSFSVGIDSTAIRKKLGIDDRHVVGFVGILRPWHGIEFLLDALALIDPTHNIHLLLVGDGPSEDSIRTKAKGLG